MYITSIIAIVRPPQCTKLQFIISLNYLVPLIRWDHQQPRHPAPARQPGPRLRPGGGGHRGALRHDGRPGRRHQEGAGRPRPRQQGGRPQLRRQVLIQLLRTIQRCSQVRPGLWRQKGDILKRLQWIYTFTFFSATSYPAAAAAWPTEPQRETCRRARTC